MKKLMIILLTIVLTLGLSGAVIAATDTATSTATVTVDEIAVVDVTNPTFTLAIVAPTQGGALPADVTNTAAYLQYTCNGADPGDTPSTTRKISVAINADTPATYDLKVAAATVASGPVGTTAGTVTLSTTSADLLTAIGNGNTGTGAADGSNLTYTVTCGSMPAVDTGTAYTVTYTLTAVG